VSVIAQILKIYGNAVDRAIKTPSKALKEGIGKGKGKTIRECS